MRRALAAAVLGISLWIGSLAWTGFIMTRTVLDPGRSEAVADALLDDSEVRAQLVDGIADAVQGAAPDGVSLPRAEVEAAAATALDSPEVEAVVRTALVDTHRAFLGEGDAPEAVDAGAFGAAGRSALVDANPELGNVLPDSPELRVPLPSERLPDLGPLRRAIEAAVPLLAGVAVLGAILAMVVSSDRPAVLRRAGIWAICLSSFVLLFAFGLPVLADELIPDRSAVVGSLIGALAEASRGPALALAGAGLGAIVVSLVWRPAPARSAAAQRLPRQPRVPRRAAAGPVRTDARPRPITPPMPRRGPAPAPAPPTPAPPTRVQPGPTVGAPGDAPTRVDHRSPGTDRTRVPEHTRPERREGRRWVDGVGWIVEGPSAIPEGARWVAGVGYVVDE